VTVRRAAMSKMRCVLEVPSLLGSASIVERWTRGRKSEVKKKPARLKGAARRMETWNELSRNHCFSRQRRGTTQSVESWNWLASEREM
jgi:hypothetical protein